MNVYKSLKLNINQVIPRAFTATLPLATLSLVLFVLSFPIKAFSQEETTTPRTFADWCLNKANLSIETRHTVDVLLQVAETTDCHQASKTLSTRTELDLTNNQIVDIKPLSTLTNLDWLSLYNNQIVDIKPLSALINLNFLLLGKNQIVDIKPLSTLTNLRNLLLDNNQIVDIKTLSTLTNLNGLSLDNNQIFDIKSLSTLTNLSYLTLANNPSLTDRTCPVQPQSICLFVPFEDE